MQHHNRMPQGAVKAAILKTDPSKITLRDFVQQSGLNYSSVATAARNLGVKFLDGRRGENKKAA